MLRTKTITTYCRSFIQHITTIWPSTRIVTREIDDQRCFWWALAMQKSIDDIASTAAIPEESVELPFMSGLR